MWRKINMMWGISLTVCTLGFAGVALADEAIRTAPLLDVTHAEQAALLIEGWLHEGRVPKTDAEGSRVSGLTAACVTLRIDGLTVGIGQAERDDLVDLADATDRSIDMVALLRRACEPAFEQLEENLRDLALRAATQGRGTDGAVTATIKDMAWQVAVDVQLGHHVEAIRIPPNALEGTVFARFVPGYHGLRFTDRETQRHTTIWPASAVASNIAPASLFVQGASALGHPASASRDVGRPTGLRLERFEVYHVVSSTLNQYDTKLIRGNVVLPPHTLNTAALERLAHAIAEHLANRFTAEGLLRGTYHPTRGQYDPPLAEPDEAVLVAYALTRYVRRHQPARPNSQKLKAVNQQAQSLVLRISQAMVADHLDASPAVVSLALLTVVDNVIAPQQVDVRDLMIARLLTHRDDEGRFRQSAEPDAKLTNHATTALITAALAAAYEQTGDKKLGTIVLESLDHLWTRSQGNPNINALPWLMIAFERARSLIEQAPPAEKQLQQARLRTLGKLVDKLIRQQVVEAPRLGPSDVIGGFELIAGPPGSPPNPTWTTAPLLTFLSIAMRDPDVRKGHDNIGWLINAQLAARFLTQLHVAETSCYYMRRPSEAIGGVRLALWDNRLTLNASAMTLLAVTEFQQTLDGLE